MRKQRLQFYRHIIRAKPTRQIVEFYEYFSQALTEKMKWMCAKHYK